MRAGLFFLLCTALSPVHAHLMSAGHGAITLQDRSALVMLAIPVDAIPALAPDATGQQHGGLQASEIQARRAQVLADLRQGLVLQADGQDAQITVEDLIVSSEPDPAGHGISQVEWLIQVQWPHASNASNAPEASSPVQRLYLALSIFPPKAPAGFAYTVQFSHPARAFSEAVLISPAQPSYTFLTERPTQTWTVFAQGWAGFWHQTALALLVLAVLATQVTLRQAGIDAVALLAGSCAAAWALQGSGWGVPDAWGQAAAAGALVVLCGAWFTQTAQLGPIRGVAFGLSVVLLGAALPPLGFDTPYVNWATLGQAAAPVALLLPAGVLLRLQYSWQRKAAAVGFAAGWFVLVTRALAVAA
jgi:hypothetical protein